MSQIQNLLYQFCDYARAFKGNTNRTIAWYKEVVGYLLKFSHIEKAEQFTFQVIEAWIIDGKINKEWKAITIKNRLRCLSLFADYLVKNQYLKENPVKKIPRPKIPQKIPGHLKREQALYLLEWVQNFPFRYKFEKMRANAILATFIFTGIRLHELINLKFNDVDIENRTLFVKGKGEKDRLIPINFSLVEILRKYLEEREKFKRKAPYFFTSMKVDGKMGDKVIPRLIKRIRDKSGIYFSPHYLRHTFAVLMLEGGCNIYALSKMMGHSDIKTTTIYLSATTSHLQEQISKHPLNGIAV